MAMTINTNISSLNAQRNLNTSQSSLSTSMQRLSSGMRINSAKDDAAGLAIATRMGTQITGLNQAARNANDGVSLAQTAEGALSTIGTNLQRIRELAVQSRNATNSSEDRSALQKEVDQLKSEIDRVAKDTSFNGTNLLDGSFTSKAFQVGANQGQRINIDSIQNAKIDQLGTWTSVEKPAAAYGTALETAGTVGAGLLTVAAPADATLKIDDFKIVVGGAEINVKGLAADAARTGAAAQDALAGNIKAALDEAKIANLNVTVGAPGSGLVNIENASVDAVTLSVAGNSDVTPSAEIAAGTNADYVALTGGALKINDKAIDVGAAYSGSDRVNQLVKEINKQFEDKSVVASNVNGSLVLKSDKDIKIEADAATTTGSGLADGTVKTIAGVAQTGFKGVSVATAEGADDTIIAMDAALKSLNSARADLGAIQNRFESVVSNLSVNSENLSASRSRIMDADFASETANLSRSQVLQQAGTAMVAQANQLPQGVLSLLR